MMTPRAPWTRRILEVLADGDWHTRDELIATASPLVPAGRASRRAETERLRSNAKHPTYTGDHPRLRPVDTVVAGRRDIIVRTIRQLVRNGTVEHADGAYRFTRGARMTWRDHAACASMPREPFYAAGHAARHAVAVCITCPVADACLAAALTAEAEDGCYAYGVRGGLTGPQRRAMLDAQRRLHTHLTGAPA